MTGTNGHQSDHLGGLTRTRQTAVATAVAVAPERNDPMPDEPRTELGYARRFIHVYGDRVRHVPAWRRWLIWEGTHWTHDATGQAARWMKVIARRLTLDAAAVMDPDQRRAGLREAKRGESSAGVAGALTLASTEAEIAVAHEALDADPFLLNCTNGTLDLRTGQLRPHDPTDLLTKATGAAYRPGPTGQVFDRFLADVQPDPEMRSFLARLLGHALEGRQAVHVLPIFWGDGANGKSTLIDAVMGALGDYASPAASGLLTARSFDPHPTETADLFGRRLAVLHETDAGRRLAEGTVKRLTGGDRIKARRMREDFWEFDPTHTFVMLTNHKPVVRGSDEGIWRRLKLVPFGVVIPEHQRDEHLGERLALEADAVLTWLVRGYQDWRTNGLHEPQQVTDATAEYRNESDALGRFIAERCLLSSTYSTRSQHLYNSWCAWCHQEGEEAGTNKAFTTALQDRGYDTKRTKVGAVFQGIGLAADSSPSTRGDGL
jgi:putative DNA primase/helicase